MYSFEWNGWMYSNLRDRCFEERDIDNHITYESMENNSLTCFNCAFASPVSVCNINIIRQHIRLT